MIRSVLALALSMTVTVPAFAQDSDADRTWGAINGIKDKITQYDQGRGIFLAQVGGKIAKYSFIALGTVAAGEAFIKPGSRYVTIPYFRTLTSPLRNTTFSAVARAVGVPAAAVGVGLLGISGVVFAAEHLWYGVAGQPHPSNALNAEQQELAAFFQQPAEAIFAQAQANPELAQKIIALNDSLTVTEGVNYAH